MFRWISFQFIYILFANAQVTSSSLITYEIQFLTNSILIQWTNRFMLRVILRKLFIIIEIKWIFLWSSPGPGPHYCSNVWNKQLKQNMQQLLVLLFLNNLHLIWIYYFLRATQYVISIENPLEEHRNKHWLFHLDYLLSVLQYIQWNK